MRTTILTLSLFVIIISTANSQNAPTPDNLKYIEVTGSGEVEYIPDQIKYSITVSDEANDVYSGDLDDRSEWKIREFQELLKKRNEQRYLKIWEILKSEGINEQAVVKDEKYDFVTKNETEFDHKIFTVSFDNFVKFKQTVAKLKAANICSGQIIDAQSLKIKDLEDTAQMLSIAHAKQKAEKLAAAVNSKLGKVLQIKEAKQSFEDLIGKGGWTAYPPLRQELHNTYLISGSLDLTENGKFVLRQAITIRYLLEN